MPGLLDMFDAAPEPRKEAKKAPPKATDDPLLSAAPTAAEQPAATLGARPFRFTPMPASFGALKKKEPLRDPFLHYHAATLTRAGDARLDFDEATWNWEAKDAVGIDVECFENFFLVCFERFSDGKRLAFEQSERSGLDADFLRGVLDDNLTVSFNGLGYDLPMVYLALGGADCGDLKRASDQLIRNGGRPWEAARAIGATVPQRLNHIDLMEPNPSVRQSLKTLHGRLHGRFLVDLPFDPDAWLTPRDMNVATLYCFNDLAATKGLWEALREPIALREALSREHRIDLRSKSDAQIGEAIVRKRVGGSAKPQPPQKFAYRAPEFVRFETTALREVLSKLTSAEFSIDADGKVRPPEFLNDLTVHIGASDYRMGIGGLHSTESHRSIICLDNEFLEDADVSSQYPRIIGTLGLYPSALGSKFLEVYRGLVDDRLAAKTALATAPDEEKARLRARSEGGKIVANGIFGKLGSTYSCLYAPDLLIATTLTGQLSILSLIERAELAGVPVVSANTDGVVFRCPQVCENDLVGIIAEWEVATGFSVERTRYRALHNASVNSYVAVKTDGKTKVKGPLADPWSEGDLRGQMSKNPQMTVVSEAVVAYLARGAPIEDTVNACRDPRKIVTVIRVAKGGEWRGTKLGRTVRYYWSTDGEPITYTGDGRRVAKTEGAKPLMELTETMPPDVDFARYIAEAKKALVDLGVVGDDGSASELVR